MGLFDFLKKKEPETPASLYKKANLISKTFIGFPSYVDDSLQSDKDLMALINAVNRPEIDSDERRRYQGELRKKVFDLLDRCLIEDPDHAPALLLYARAASYNYRAEDRPAVIAACERVLDRIDRIQKGTRAYSLIEKDIEGYGKGNFFNQPERWLADFYFDMGNLYLTERRYPNAITQFQKSINLMPLLLHFYCGLSEAYVKSCRYADALALWERAEKLPIERSMKDAVIRPHHEGVKECRVSAKIPTQFQKNSPVSFKLIPHLGSE